MLTNPIRPRKTYNMYFYQAIHLDVIHSLTFFAIHPLADNNNNNKKFTEVLFNIAH